MAKAQLLFVDNDQDFLSERAEALREAGYEVLEASSEDRARAIIASKHFDLAIVDVRLVSERDKADFSGIRFAKSHCRHVPTIILTAYPSTPAAVESLRSKVRGQTTVMDFVAKEDGPGALLDSIGRQLRRRVFIVHGHHSESKQTVARFVEHLALQAVILNEQPDSGRAIIEKFEDYSNVEFAIVLLTPDDVGGVRATGDTSDRLNPRARQNVIFELGYFVGKLGRRRVAVLYKENVEIPSDYNGVVYIPMTTGDGWKLPLAQNMKNAGLEFELGLVTA